MVINMNIIGSYIAVPETTARSFIYRQSSISDYVMAHDGDAGCIDIGKAWHAIFYLLTGCVQSESADGPLSKVVPLENGIAIDDDFGYGPPRLLASDEVKELDALISGITVDSLKEKFELNEMINAEIYPLEGFEENPGEFFEYVNSRFLRLKSFLHAAAQNGLTVIFYLS